MEPFHRMMLYFALHWTRFDNLAFSPSNRPRDLVIGQAEPFQVWDELHFEHMAVGAE